MAGGAGVIHRVAAASAPRRFAARWGGLARFQARMLLPDLRRAPAAPPTRARLGGFWSRSQYLRTVPSAAKSVPSAASAALVFAQRRQAPVIEKGSLPV